MGRTIRSRDGCSNDRVWFVMPHWCASETNEALSFSATRAVSPFRPDAGLLEPGMINLNPRMNLSDQAYC